LKLNIALLGSSFYYAVNMLSLRLFEVLSMWLIIRLLPSQDIALVGASLGFIALLNAINFSPYRRIYKSFDALQSRLSEHISSYVMFWAIQSAAMLCLALLAGLFYISFGFGAQILVVMAGLVVAYRFNSLQLIVQEVFFVKFKQKLATYFNAALTGIFLLGLGVLFIYPQIEIYVGLIVLKAIITAVGLFFLAVPELGFKFSVPSDWIVLVKDALAEFALYDHFIGAAIDIINRVFLFLLGFFALHGALGDYTIALTIANLLTFVPLIIYRTCMLAISRSETKEGLEKILSAFTKYLAVVSIAQFAALYFLLGAILSILRPGDAQVVFNYTLMLSLGTTIMNSAHAVHAVALLRTDTRKYFLHVIGPITAFSIAGYFLSAAYEPDLIGVVFVLCAILFCLLSYTHVLGNAKISIKMAFILQEEKEAVGHLLGKFLKKKRDKKQQAYSMGSKILLGKEGHANA